MSSLLPHRFLFRYSLPVHRDDALPRKGEKKGLLALKKEFALPDFGPLDNAPTFGEFRMAWNPQGLGISVQVRGDRKTQRPASSAPSSDGLQIWLDTRNTQNIHRASRFCHHFSIALAGPAGKGPAVSQHAIARAREETPFGDLADVRVAADVGRDGYLLEAWFPASVLNGYDPDANPRLGFYFWLRDRDLGDQYLSVGDEFPFAQDPSLWATLELVD